MDTMPTTTTETEIAMTHQEYAARVNQAAGTDIDILEDAWRYAIEQEVLRADLVVGAVLVPGAKAPKLVTNDLVSRMRSGAVLVDIAIDQGGCFEGSRPTTHDDPTFMVHDTVFYCVANMPGAVPHTSTYALTNVTLPYAVALANQGWRGALASIPALRPGLNTHAGHITYEAVAQAFDLPWITVDEAVAS